MNVNTYVIWEPARGESETGGDTVSARTAQEAVEKWADWDDCTGGEYSIIDGDPATVKVRDLRTGELSEWVVHGETVRTYTAKLSILKAPL